MLKINKNYLLLLYIIFLILVIHITVYLIISQQNLKILLLKNQNNIIVLENNYLILTNSNYIKWLKIFLNTFVVSTTVKIDYKKLHLNNLNIQTDKEIKVFGDFIKIFYNNVPLE